MPSSLGTRRASHRLHAGWAEKRRPDRALPIQGRGMNPHAPTLGFRQRIRPSRAGQMACPGGRRAAGVLGQGVGLTCHRTAAATRDCPSTPNEGDGAQRRHCPEVSRRWRVRHPASAGHLIR